MAKDAKNVMRVTAVEMCPPILQLFILSLLEELHDGLDGGDVLSWRFFVWAVEEECRDDNENDGTEALDVWEDEALVIDGGIVVFDDAKDGWIRRLDKYCSWCITSMMN